MKFKIKKKCLLLGLLVSLMFGLISCGKKDESSTSPTDTPLDENDFEEEPLVSTNEEAGGNIPQTGGVSFTAPNTIQSSAPPVSLNRDITQCPKGAGHKVCRFLECQTATQAALNKTIVKAQQTTCTKGSDVVKLILHEYTYQGVRPPNALLCSLEKEGYDRALAFAHRTQSFCNGGLNLQIRKYKARGYACSTTSLSTPSQAPSSSATPLG